MAKKDVLIVTPHGVISDRALKYVLKVAEDLRKVGQKLESQVLNDLNCELCALDDQVFPNEPEYPERLPEYDKKN